jgi:hypothetical protein
MPSRHAVLGLAHTASHDIIISVILHLQKAEFGHGFARNVNGLHAGLSGHVSAYNRPMNIPITSAPARQPGQLFNRAGDRESNG